MAKSGLLSLKFLIILLYQTAFLKKKRKEKKKITQHHYSHLAFTPFFSEHEFCMETNIAPVVKIPSSSGDSMYERKKKKDLVFIIVEGLWCANR